VPFGRHVKHHTVAKKNLTVMSSKAFSGGATNKIASVVPFPIIQDLY